MEKIILRSQQGAKDTYVKEYDAKKGILVETHNIREAKVYKTRAGAESSARSIFDKKFFGDETTKNIYNSVIWLDRKGV